VRKHLTERSSIRVWQIHKDEVSCNGISTVHKHGEATGFHCFVSQLRCLLVNPNSCFVAFSNDHPYDSGGNCLHFSVVFSLFFPTLQCQPFLGLPLPLWLEGVICSDCPGKSLPLLALDGHPMKHLGKCILQLVNIANNDGNKWCEEKKKKTTLVWFI